MTYLIVTNHKPPYLTDSFDIICDYNGVIGMVVYEIENKVYTDNGVTWKEIDSLMIQNI